MVVMKLVPPTLSLTHSFLRGGEEEVEVTVTFVEAAMAARAKTGLGGVYTLLSLHSPHTDSRGRPGRAESQCAAHS